MTAMRDKRGEVYKARDGWRWRLRAGNNRIIACSGESFSSKRAALRAYWNTVVDFGDATLVPLEVTP